MCTKEVMAVTRSDIHEDVEKYFVQLNDIGHDLGYTELGREVKTDDEIKKDVLDIVDKHFETKGKRNE